MERDLRDAAAVCRQLRIPLHEADFVSAYWNQVGCSVSSSLDPVWFARFAIGFARFANTMRSKTAAANLHDSQHLTLPGQVFSEFLAQCGRGLTPNPDLACNRHIKFDALLRFAGDLGADLGRLPGGCCWVLGRSDVFLSTDVLLSCRVQAAAHDGLW